MDSGQHTCILFKVRRLGRIASQLPAAVKPSFDRWIVVGSRQPKNTIKYQLFFLQLANFYTFITVFNVLSGGDQPRPDDPHPFFAWGTSGASRRWSQLRLFQRGSRWLLSIKGFSRDSLGSVKRGAEQIRSLSTEAFHLPMSMSFTRCSSLHRVLWIKERSVLYTCQCTPIVLL